MAAVLEEFKIAIQPGSLRAEAAPRQLRSRVPAPPPIFARMSTPDPMTRLNAALEGRYRIESKLGEGGMATVYLADDIKHERKVALKVLKPELAAVVGAERFLAEIKTTANLQHPHILPLFDSGEADSFLFYVMPYVEGETLRDRIDRDKQLPVDEAIGIATAVANALHTAHEQGVIHRDIKPANILMSRGEPLVADFGIALAVSAGGGGRLTETGLSLGTPYYMSPEQATGDQTVGPASDTFALACVLYEMLVGEPPHPGSTAQAVLGKIIQGLPVSATAMRQSVPANVDAAIRKALEKLPADRFTGAQDFAKALADPGFRHGETEATEAMASVGPWRQGSVVFASLFVAASALAAWGWLKPSLPASQPATVRTVLSDFYISDGGGQKLAISRDGSQIAVATNDGSGLYRLFVRRLDGLGFREIEVTPGVVYPTFSPDGDWLAFSGRSGGLRRVQLSGGPVLPVADGNSPHWGVDGTIVFVGRDGGLHLVSPSGADLTPIVDASSDDGSLVRGADPHLLPDGQAVLFAGNGPGGQPLRIVELESGVVTDLGIEGIRPQYSASGHLLYRHNDQMLMAVPFDLATHEVTGEASTVLPEAISAFVVSETGTAFYGLRGGGGGVEQRQRLLEVGLDGSEEVLPLDPSQFREPRWSPDGEWVAYAGSAPGASAGESDIYLYNVDLRRPPTRLTVEGDNRMPLWSPDGTRVAFSSIRNGVDGEGLFVKTLGDAPAELIFHSTSNVRPSHWPFNDLLVYIEGFQTNSVWGVDPSSDSVVATLYTDEESVLRDLRISPDRSLAAYSAGPAASREVYVRAFPEAGQPYVVSQDGALAPFWAPDGNTLYYWTPGGGTDVKHVVAVRFDLGPPFTVISTDTVITGAYRFDSSDLHPDGDRIIVSQEAIVVSSGADPVDLSELPQHLIVVNWFTELKERMGGN